MMRHEEALPSSSSSSPSATPSIASRAASVCEADEVVWLDDEMRQGRWLASSQSHLEKSLSVKSRGIPLKKTKQNDKTQPSVVVKIQWVIIVNVFGGSGENVKCKKAVLSKFYHLTAYFITLMIYIIYRMKDCENNKPTSFILFHLIFFFLTNLASGNSAETLNISLK